MEKVRLGIAGPGRIAHRVMKDLRKAEHIDIVAVASRSLERAQSAANEFDIPLAYGSYEEVAASDEVDLVYVAVPHPFHCSLSKLFLSAGKHVIVEKPFAMNAKEASEMIACAKASNRFLMEAMWSRFFPAAQSLKALIESGSLGRIRRITADFAFKADLDYEDRLYNPTLGGGSLLDVGVYPLSLMCFYKGELPEKVQVLFDKAETGVDSLCSFQIQFKDGAVGQGFSALDVTTDQGMKIYGTKGWVEMPDFWHPVGYIVHKPGNEPEVHEFASENEGFHHEFEFAATTIISGQIDQSVISLNDSKLIMKIMDGMREDMNVKYPCEQCTM